MSYILREKMHEFYQLIISLLSEQVEGIYAYRNIEER